MRRKQKTSKPAKRRVAQEPMAESIVPLDIRGMRSWASMSDEELVAFAQRFVDENGIKRKSGLEKADSRLYKALMRREGQGDRLIDRLVFEKRLRNWASMSDDGLVAFAQRFVDENGIKNRKGLEKTDNGLYQALKRKDRGETRLIARVVFEEGRRSWASMSDDELVAFAQRFVDENGVKGRGCLQKTDFRMYRALMRRGDQGDRLMEKMIFERMGRKPRYWASMSDDGLVAFAQRFVDENGIKNRKGLRRTDAGLYRALMKRGNPGDRLMERLVFEKRLRNWASMSDDGLVAFAQRFVDENGVKGRGCLRKTDLGLYSVLYAKGLLDAVFSDLERAKARDAVRDVVSAIGEFS